MTELPSKVVLFGALRSGTTMLRLMLDAHPRLSCPGETDFLTDFLIPAPDGGWVYDLEQLDTNRIFTSSVAQLPQTPAASEGLASMLGDLAGRKEGLLVLVAHRGLERLLDFYPDIRVIHLVRDPRDVARSAIGMGWAGNVYYGAPTWLSTEWEWERCAPRLSPDQSLQIQYEDLVRSPEAVLQAVCAFCGESYDPAMLSYGKSSTYSEPDPTLIEQWRRKQTKEEVGLIEPLFAPLLTARGYAESGYPQIHPGPLKRLRLWAEHKRSVWGRKIARFGVYDPLVLKLAHMLGRPQLAKGARLRMNAIQRMHLK